MQIRCFFFRFFSPVHNTLRSNWSATLTRLHKVLVAADQQYEGPIKNNVFRTFSDQYDDLTMGFFLCVRGLRKADQEAVDLAWKEEKQRINSDPSGSQSYSAIKNGNE